MIALTAYLPLAILPVLVLLLDPHQSPNFFPNPDVLPTLWNFWWFDRAIAAGRNPWATDMLFYPQGTTLFLHTFEVVDAVLTAPIRWLFGLQRAWLAAYIHQGFVSLIGAHLLARRLGAGKYGAVMAAVLLTMGSYRYVNSPALSVLATGYALLLAWAVVGCWQEPQRRRHGVWLGISAVVLLLTNLYYLLFLTLILGVVGVAFALWTRPGAASWKGWAVQLGIAAAIGIVPLGFIGNGIRRASAEGGSVATFEEWNQVRGSADLAQLLLPLRVRPLVEGTTIPDWPWSFGSVPQRSFSFAPPLALLLIAGVGWRWGEKGDKSFPSRRIPAGLALAAAVAFFLALGPEVKIWTTHDPADASSAQNTGEPARWRGVSVPSPYRLIAQAPVFRQIRCNNRAGFFYQACLLILLAPLYERGLFALLGLRRKIALSLLCQAGALVLIMWECPIHFLQGSPDLPADPLIAVRDAKGPGAVATYPESSYILQGMAMRDQTIHERPIMGGYISRLPADYLEWVANRPWAQHLHLLAAGHVKDLTPGQQESFRRAAAADKLRFLVVYKVIIPSDDPQEFLNYLVRNGLGRIMVDSEALASVELLPPAGS